MSERIYLDASGVPRQIYLDVDRLIQFICDLPHTGTADLIGEAIGRNIAEAIYKAQPERPFQFVEQAEAHCLRLYEAGVYSTQECYDAVRAYRAQFATRPADTAQQGQGGGDA